jgi:hypothetical protein
MVLTQLYNSQERLAHSNLCFDKGVAELGGADNVASLSFATEKRAEVEGGANLYGRVREGVCVVPVGYVLNQNPLRVLVPLGFPLQNPETATQVNRDIKWYTLGEGNVQEVLRAIKAGLILDEAHVKKNILELSLEGLEEMPEGIFLFGGQGTDEQRKARAKKAGQYFLERFKETGKSNKSVKLYLPALNVAQDGCVVATQLWSGGVVNDFCLYGGNLSSDDGVFGVS